MLCDGVDAVAPIPENRWPAEAIFDADRNSSGSIYTRFGSFLGDVSGFDADFFGVSPREALSVDPQQRLLLEVTWEALEHAAIAPATLRNSQTGVFVGIGQNDYAQLLLNAGDLGRITRFDGTGNGFCFGPGRLSHTFGLRGPSVAIDCACSSSLVAVHLACQSLRARECDLALAAGVQLILSAEVTVFLCRAGALAPDGRCKAFDAAADGFGRGEGCGVVVLKRLSEAVADGDLVWGIIRGSAVNHDGRSSGLTVPSAAAQVQLLSRALAVAGLEPWNISYVEAHGTGTQLGDPIEVEALAAVYGKDRSRTNPLWLASAKGNHGHLEAAAGVAGLIKTVLSLHHRKFPPQLNFKKPNPHIPWNALHVKIPTLAEEWSTDSPRIAGVSSFGFGGTNAHVIVEAAADAPSTTYDNEPGMLLLSARTAAAVRELAGRYAAHWERHPDLAVGDVCRTAAIGRSHFAHRIAASAASREAACSVLGSVARGELPPQAFTGHVSSNSKEVAVRNGDSAATLEQVAADYVRGLPIDWTHWFPKAHRAPVVLPTYPFERQRYWIDEPRITARAFAGASVATVAPDETIGLYEICWKRSERPTPDQAPALRKQWVILCDESGIGDAIADELQEQGQACIRARLGLNTRKEAGGEWSIALSDPSAFAKMMREVRALRSEALIGVVHSWSCGIDSISPSRIKDYLDIVCISSLRLFQSLRLHKGDPPPRVWLLTRASQATVESATEGTLFQAMLWGLGRSIALEWSELWGGLHDLSAAPDRFEIARVVNEFLHPSFDQVAWRGTDAWIPALRRRRYTNCKRLTLRPDGAYLVTGGCGAIGLRVSNWLVERGARFLVLTGRREPSSEASMFVKTAASRGARVWLRQSNCADLQSTLHLVREIDEAGFPLRGVFHAAGIGGRRESDKLDPAQFHEVCSAKVEGAWNLHEVTRDRELDYFILFSSIASVWGSKGQIHYAAANQFLDALACLRSRLGLPALSVNWGPWAGGGMASEKHRKQLERIGVRELAPESAVNALDFLLAADVAQLAVADIDWRLFKEVYQAGSRRRLLDDIEAAADEEEAPTLQRPSLLKRLEGVIATQRRGLLVEHLQKEVAGALGFGVDRKLDGQQGFFEMGMDSLMAVDLKNRLGKALGTSLPATLIFDFPNIDGLAGFLLRHLELEQSEAVGSLRRATPVSQAEPIAIVSLGCRFPGGAIDAQSFWQMLHEGADAIGKVPGDRWDRDAYFDENRELSGTMYTQAGGFLDRVDGFDAHFFGISPREALSMDPQQRLLLEVSYEALENAPLGLSRSAAERTGVFIGITNNDYAQLLLQEGYDQIDPYFVTGNSLNAAAGRLSYILGLQGPSMTVDTACSSSLVTVHLACQSLAHGECDQALAGGVNLILSPAAFIATCRSQMLSPDGRCKTFDASANGYGRGEGCGVVVLKRLSDALAGGNQVLAVIRGSAVNQDGASGGFTVPNGQSQQQLLREALVRAGVEPHQVSYVEAHGTGTPLGDPIEMGALSAVLCAGRSKERPLVVGSVKTNIGHLESAAGIAGLIKTVLALQHGEIPSHRHFRNPNAHIPWDEIAVIVPTENRSWESEDGKRIAGVSAFGFSGTNAHMVLESAPRGDSAASVLERPLHLLTLSAKTEDALAELAERYVGYLRQHPSTSLADICFTANQRRSYNHRLALVTSSVEQVREQLLSFGKGDPGAGLVRGETAGGDPPRVAFLFTGQGSQYSGMGRELYRIQPTFRQILDECAAILRPYLKTPLLEVLFSASNGRARFTGSESLWLAHDHSSHAALFVLQYALAELWQSWGIHASVVMGDGIGEYAAACFAGVLKLEEALRLLVEQELRSPRPTAESFSVLDGKRNSRIPMVANQDQLLQQNYQASIEIGPHPMAQEKGPYVSAGNGAPRLAGLINEQSDWQTLLQSLAALYALGARIDWTAFDRPYARHGVTLPVYPFRRQSVLATGACQWQAPKASGIARDGQPDLASAIGLASTLGNQSSRNRIRITAGRRASAVPLRPSRF